MRQRMSFVCRQNSTGWKTGGFVTQREAWAILRSRLRRLAQVDGCSPSKLVRPLHSRYGQSGALDDARMEFDPDQFLEKLNQGLFDGRLNEEIQKLSSEQLEQIARLLTARLAANKGRD